MRPGVMTIQSDEGRTQYTVSGGFIEVLRNQVTILAEALEEVSSIDIDRARKAAERARKRLESSGGDDINIERAKASLNRATNRIKASEV